MRLGLAALAVLAIVTAQLTLIAGIAGAAGALLGVPIADTLVERDTQSSS